MSQDEAENLGLFLGLLLALSIAIGAITGAGEQSDKPPPVTPILSESPPISLTAVPTLFDPYGTATAAGRTPPPPPTPLGRVGAALPLIANGR